jgi:diadenosine tetraphosphate (Ap4A) HIT family hydrolase
MIQATHLLILVLVVALTKGFTIGASSSQYLYGTTGLVATGWATTSTVLEMVQGDDPTASEPEINGNSYRYMPFGTMFQIPESHIFYISQYSVAFVHDLSPIVKKGHVICVPQRVTSSLKDLSEEEYIDLTGTIQKVKALLEREYGATPFGNVAVQWGNSQTAVPHVHVHILPQSTGNFRRGDEVYQRLQHWLPPSKIAIVQQQSIDREARDQQLADEASLYRGLVC